ncbi:MAG: nitrite reductase (NADH) small subunit [Oleiphilaceae bacterium]|jgi:nitrite reductase (NADH) small subunit
MKVEQILKDNMSYEPANESGCINVICNKSDLVENSGVCALINDEQVALFYLPHTEKKLFAVSNWDPIGKANVLSRGILGDIKGKIVVASPLYKQHFDLETGICIEDETVKLKTFPIFLEGDSVIIG